MDSQQSDFCSASFEQAIAEFVLPGEVTKPAREHDRLYSPEWSPEWDNEDDLEAFALADELEERIKAKENLKRAREDDQSGLELAQRDEKRTKVAQEVSKEAEDGNIDGQRDISEEVMQEEENNPAYAASKFGGLATYMKHKRQKLQIQNAAIASTQGQGKPQIFKGLHIYINGYTVPPLEKLRTMIVQHGGNYIPYLDRKGMITHILATNLTPAKFKEFASYKVATPKWIVDSVEAERLIDWKKYKLLPHFPGGERAMDTFFASKEPASSGTDGGKTSSAAKGVEVSSTRETNIVVDLDKTEGDETPRPVRAEKPRVFTVRPDSLPAVPAPNVLPREVVEPQPDLISIIKDTPVSAREIFAPSKGQAPALSTDPMTFEGAAMMGYAKNAENKEAKRLMQDEAWRGKNTAASDTFLEGYYKNSRLHHLSTWKAELKTLVAEAQKRAEATASQKQKKEEQQQDFSLADATLPKIGGGRAQLSVHPNPTGDPNERVIMHVDFDAFFVSCGLASRPELKGKPVVVCHAQGNQGASSTSEIASCSYEARAFGVKNGMSLGQARKLCTDIRTIPYEFEAYREKSLAFYTILMAYADELQAVSIDEALVDVSVRVHEMRQAPTRFEAGSDGQVDYAKKLAEDIRAEIRLATDCEVSIGVASNMLLARLATRHAKPAGSYHLLASEVGNFMSSLDIGELHNFGYATKKKIEATFKTSNCGKLLEIPKSSLQACLGDKNGQTLYNFVRGIDPRKLTPHQERRSVSAEVNYGIRFVSDEEVVKFLTDLSNEVSRRLKSIARLGRQVTLKVMIRDPDAPVEAPKFMGHGVCQVQNRSSALSTLNGGATDDPARITSAILALYRSQTFDAKELRGIGIQVQKVEPGNAAQERGEGQGVLNFAAKPARPPQPAPVQKKPMIVDLTLDDSPSPFIVKTDRPKRSKRNSSENTNAKAGPSREVIVAKPTKRARRKLPEDIGLSTWMMMDTSAQQSLRDEWERRGIACPRAYEEREVSVSTKSKSSDRDKRSDSLKRGSETPRAITRSPQPAAPKTVRIISIDPIKRPKIRMGLEGSTQDMDSILDGISAWMQVAACREPDPRELKVLRKYLERCFDENKANIGGPQDAVRVFRWWRHVCRSIWADMDITDPAREIEVKWKEAFVTMKGDIDTICIERYNASLNLS